jgi:hypothetical protein
MLFALIGLGLPELIVLGLLCSVPMVGGAIILIVLTMNKKPPREPEERDRD